MDRMGRQGVATLERRCGTGQRRRRKVSGFIVGRQAGGEAEILNLAVTPAKRRKGGGVCYSMRHG